MKISKMLSQKEVDALPLGVHNVGGVVGLCIRKQLTTKQYFLRYHVGKKVFFLNFPKGLKLKQYRAMAAEARHKLEQGINPKNELLKVRDIMIREMSREFFTFKKLSLEWIEYRHQNKFWDAHEKEYRDTQARLKKYIYPVIAKKRVDEITAEDIVQILLKVGSSESMCSKIKAILNHIFKWAIIKQYRSSNPVEHVSLLLRDIDVRFERVNNRASLDFNEVPSFVAMLMQKRDMSSLLLVFSILTCARSKAVRLMQWKEIDFFAKEWIIPEKHDKIKGIT